MEFNKCPIIGTQLKPGDLKVANGPVIEYETQAVGRVRVTIAAYQELITGKFDRALIAGICRNRTADGEEPELVDSTFIHGGYKNLNPPIEFEEKAYHFMKYLYLNGGRENKDFELHSFRDCALAYALPEEFIRIVDHLQTEYFITIRSIKRLAGGSVFYLGVKISSKGKAEAQKVLPQVPLIGLVSQEITAGNGDIDAKINHARQLFFSQPPTMDNMRSACESLSFVLEPLRKTMSEYFKDDDVSDFFQIVNRFDIRHNKDNTKSLVHPEQLEWVFYTLLNSINAYTKLKARLSDS